MKSIFTCLLLAGTISFSCNSTISSVFGKKTPREKYEEVLDDHDLEKTPAGREWLAASKKALTEPQEVQLPYKQIGVFGTDKSRALGLEFKAKRGEQLRFSLIKKAASSFPLYADLFSSNGIESSPLLSVDTTSSEFVFDVSETGSYVLRLQPELYRSGEYELSVYVGPTLSFPVGNNKGSIGSFWGANRDGGRRSHEGIDIFAPKLTPVVAAADGVITGVQEGGLGGKVVWLRLIDKNVTLYYAHLDKQLVHQGQSVKKGEVLGLVGNTGNARHTPSHLHFGVYTTSGPIDPLPFVNTTVRKPAPVPIRPMNRYLRLTKTQKLGDSSVKANTLLVPIAVTAKGYISELPGGQLMQLPFAAVQTTTQVVKPATIPIAATDASGKKKRF